MVFKVFKQTPFIKKPILHNQIKPMKKISIFLFVILISMNFVFSQGVAINTTGASADPSAGLDINSTLKGVLIPRMTDSQRNAIVNPALGLIIYNITTECFNVYKSSGWFEWCGICILPSVPVANAGSGATTTSFTAKWSASSIASSYYLDVSNENTFTSYVPGFENLNVGNVITYDVTGLSSSTPYYYRVRGHNNCGTSGSSETIMYSTLFVCGDNVTDVDGNSYNTVAIGSQCWMKQNLKTTHYYDGTEIPHVPSNTAWASLSSPAYCWYNNDPDTYKNPYGALYNFYAVNTGKLCPAGWHVPSNAEWGTLISYLGGSAIAGGKMKETGTNHWQSPNEGATNESNFLGLPGGHNNYITRLYQSLGADGFWWSRNSSSFNLNYNSAGIPSYSQSNLYGFSVRCLKD